MEDYLERIYLTENYHPCENPAQRRSKIISINMHTYCQRYQVQLLVYHVER